MEWHMGRQFLDAFDTMCYNPDLISFSEQNDTISIHNDVLMRSAYSWNFMPKLLDKWLLKFSCEGNISKHWRQKTHSTCFGAKIQWMGTLKIALLGYEICSKNWHELFASFRICGLHGKIQNRSLEILSGQRKEAMPSFMSYFIGFAAVSLLRRIRGRKLGRWLMINAWVRGVIIIFPRHLRL